jgi:hypothetical protein
MTRRPGDTGNQPGRLGGTGISLSLLGVVAYAVCYSTLSRYYTELGTSPDFAGLDYRTVLSRSVGLLSVTLIIGGLALFTRSALHKLDSVRRSPVRARQLDAAVLVCVLILGLVAYTLIGRAVDVRDQAILEGRPVSPISLFGTTLISVHAYPVTLIAPVGSTARTIANDQLLLIGASTSTIVIFDVTTERTILLGLSDLTVAVRPIHSAR